MENGGTSLDIWGSELGLADDQGKRRAMEIGARFLAFGFSGSDIDLMIQRHHAEEASSLGITPEHIASVDILGMNRE